MSESFEDANAPAMAYSILMKSLPSSFVKAYGLESTSKGVWQDWAATNTVPLASTKEVAEMRRRLISDQIDDEARFSAIAFVGAIRDEGSVPALISLLSRCPDQSSLVDCIVEAIANINTAESITLLISLVVSPETGEQVRKTAGYCLHRSSGTNATLDLRSQRLLLKHLAVNQSNEPVVASILQALEGHPIREGGELIAELAVHDRLSAETRAQAVAVLKTVAMRELLDAVIPILLRDPTSIIAERTAEVAVSRRVPVFADFFKQRLGKNLSRVAYHRMINLLAWNLRNLVGEQLAANQQLLYSLVHAAFENLQAGDGDISKALTIAFESLPCNSLLVVNPETEAVASQCIKHAAIELDLTAEGKLLFAIKLIQLIRTAGLCDELIAILKGAFELSKSKQTAATACWRIACAAASSVCDIEPARLLLLPIDCEPASLALQHASINRGWFVYASRILDCEGIELASLKFASPVSASPHGADLSFIVNQLTKNLRERLSLYLLAISPPRWCQLVGQFEVCLQCYRPFL